MDGKHFPMSEYKAGVTAPPLHPFCRSIVVPYSADGLEDKKVLGKDNSEEQIEKIVANGLESDILFNRSIYRKTANIGPFSSLEVPMQKKAVLNICQKYGIDIKGLTIKIQRSESLLGTMFYGSTDYDNIGRIDLMPNAFVDEEQLVKTILHEKCHVEQLKKFGKNYVQSHLSEMETEAYLCEKKYKKIK